MNFKTLTRKPPREFRKAGGEDRCDLTIRAGRLWLRWLAGTAIVLLFGGACSSATAGTNTYEEGLRALHAGDYDKAIQAFNYTLETIPHDYEAMSNRAVARFYKKEYGPAIADATRALEINPYYSVGANQLAWMLATCPDPAYRDGRRAVALAEKVVQRFPEANFMDTLAAAYAEAGNLEAAVRVQKMAVQQLKKANKETASFQERLQTYGQAATVKPADKKLDSQRPVIGLTSDDAVKKKDPTSLLAARPLDANKDVSSNNTGKKATTDASDPALRRYSVHLFSFRQRRSAEEAAGKLARENYPAFVGPIHINEDPAPWFRVYSGAFSERHAAVAYAEYLQSQGQEWAKVMLLPKNASTVAE